MNLSDLTERDAVLQAIEEFDELGREAFLDKYGFGPARDCFVLYRQNHMLGVPLERSLERTTSLTFAGTGQQQESAITSPGRSRGGGHTESSDHTPRRRCSWGTPGTRRIRPVPEPRNERMREQDGGERDVSPAHGAQNRKTVES